MYKKPLASTVTPWGWFSVALIAGPPSPLPGEPPFPTIVVMVPEGLTIRIREFRSSLMYRLPLRSIAMSSGPFSVALVAGPLSPL